MLKELLSAMAIRLNAWLSRRSDSLLIVAFRIVGIGVTWSSTEISQKLWMERKDEHVGKILVNELRTAEEIELGRRGVPQFAVTIPDGQFSEEFLKCEPGRLEVLNTGRNWTEEQPTLPGWYWRREASGDVTILELGHLRKDQQIPDVPARLWVLSFLDECGELRELPPDGQWAGPLEPPA